MCMGEIDNQAPLKYRVLTSYTRNGIEELINRFEAEGYKLHTINVTSGTVDGSPYNDFMAVMSLSNAGKYDDIESLYDVKPEDVNDFFKDGYEILETYAKVVRMVKRSE